MSPIESASIPRLPQIVAPELQEILLSRFLWLDSGDAPICVIEEASRSGTSGKEEIGAGYLLPLNKGFVFMPMVTAEELVLKGDLYSIAKIVTSLALEFVIPLPEVIEAGKQIGETIVEMFELDLRLPRFANAESQHYFNLLKDDARTFGLPYVNLTDWRIARGRPNADTLELKTTDSNGVSVNYEFIFKAKIESLDSFLANRWRLEFEALLVEIVGEAFGGAREWKELNTQVEAIVRRELQEPEVPIRLSDLEVNGVAPRFYLSARPAVLPVVFTILSSTLKEAGYVDIEAIAMAYLYEDTARHKFTLPPDHIAWVRAITDRKLAREILERMSPNLSEQRAMLASNEVNKAEFRLSYVEMLERGARGETLGRVHRREPSPFY